MGATDGMDGLGSVESDADDDTPAIREGVAEFCARYPDEYWREKDRERTYPTEFVAALTEAGYLAALILAAYGGSGLGLPRSY